MTDDDQSLLELFREEAAAQTRVLSDGLLALEHRPADAAALEACMRAAHSLKGAARIIGLQDGVDIAHVMEECFVGAQRGELQLTPAHIDVLLRGVDMLLRVGEAKPDAPVTRADIDGFVARMASHETADGDGPQPAPDVDVYAQLQAQLQAEALAQRQETPEADPTAPSDAPAQQDTHASARTPDRMLRVRAANLDRVLSLSGEVLVESRWLKPFATSMLRLKRTQRETSRALDALYDTLAEHLDDAALAALADVRTSLNSMQHTLGARLDELDRFDRSSANLAQLLYDEALQCRMRPFGDATHAYPRVVRDLARSLGKRVKFEIVGTSTQVDRDILDMLDAPLGHLLRNALDHGIESPDARIARGKPAEAHVTLEARHSAGKLLISVSDDGAGIDLDNVRASVIRRKLADADTAARLSEQELLDFLLLPGFSMREQVTDVSGRGVGLDAVHEMVKAVRGTVRIVNEPDRGSRFVMQLPLTLSVVRSLLVDVGGEAYAFPLAHVRRTLELARADIDMLEGQQHFAFDGKPVGLVTAHQLLGAQAGVARESVSVVVIGDERETYGVAVDRFLGERMLVVQPLDPRLGKIRDIAAGALMENGDAVLIVDVDDLLRSVDKLVRGGQLDRIGRAHDVAARQRKHVLVVEDSLTVRELERKLLEKRGYAVTVAVDGMDGWNALHNQADGTFDLVVTDIDMPRMDGIELVTLIKRDPLFKAVPVMIVSYKDRDEDRRRGLEAGADYYLAKGSFHDEALLDAVRDLIGEASA
ncbi:hybrid sensor histidine kinase/response regulator [Paraburkholderia caribensis]|uniref:Chemotaxis protein CheA n=1 Tax=Paraburkholderia caribensis TaxID=75105 RepID=A0A9Q6S3U7_9BURK|nr:hybrid sensor histidine kinase/response regulator [Paraburkholderia caribensis]MCO4883012.1 hybrid sensor histidine kinase/response regulator [Paraburkholderia caribensis]PTB28023.1 hybrid sensor histidine kinase/response regulator [Paraburkholderia caribensis]QLB64074.1 hybrid sensor histidine kinase/response regulator [Paraburkholderia caribensis]